MKSVRSKQAAAAAVAQERKAETVAEMNAIAKHFSSPEGKHVLELLMRKAGVLGSRFGPDSDPIKAAIREGETRIPLFIIQCLKQGGETQITFPL